MLKLYHCEIKTKNQYTMLDKIVQTVLFYYFI